MYLCIYFVAKVLPLPNIPLVASFMSGISFMPKFHPQSIRLFNIWPRRQHKFFPVPLPRHFFPSFTTSHLLVALFPLLHLHKLDDVYFFHTAQFPANRSGLPASEFLNGKSSASSTVVTGYDAHSRTLRLSEKAGGRITALLWNLPPTYLSKTQTLTQSLKRNQKQCNFHEGLPKMRERVPVNNVVLGNCFMVHLMVPPLTYHNVLTHRTTL